MSRTYYLDLARLARLQDQRNTPFTPAVHVYYALREALGGAARAAYEANYTTALMVERLEAYYRGVIAAHAAGGAQRRRA